MKRIFAVDDHPVFLMGLKDLINRQPDLEYVGGAESGRAALLQLEELDVDLVTVDMSLGDMSGLALIGVLKRVAPDRPVLALSMHDEMLYAERALRAGATGYVEKDAPVDVLIDGLRRAASGQLVVSPSMSDTLVRRMVGGNAAAAATMSPMDALSNRELEIFELIGLGIRTRDVAKKLHISTKTVETHQANIKTKLGLANSTELLRTAITWLAERGTSPDA